MFIYKFIRGHTLMKKLKQNITKIQSYGYSYVIRQYKYYIIYLYIFVCIGLDL